MSPTPYSHELDWPSHLIPFDPWNEAIKENPFPHYAWMLEHAPVLRARTAFGDSWVLSRHSDVQFAFRNPKLFSSRLRADSTGYPHLLIRDDPDHTRLRAVVAHVFTPKAVAAIEGKIRVLAETKLQRLIDAKGGEVMANLPVPLTTETIASLLGLPLSERERYRQWTEDFNSFLGRISGSAPGSPTDESGTKAFFEHMTNALVNAPADGDSILTSIARARREGILSEDEALTFGPILFGAGTDTTTLLIGNGFLLLSEMPHLLTRLRGSPQDVPKFVEELVRFRSSVQRATRITTAEVEISGQLIPAGSFIFLLLASANRDPQKFPHPEVFDLDRAPGGSVGFGFGVHACLGSWLARMEARLVFEAVARMVSKVELDPEATPALVPFTGGNGALLGPKFLRVKLTPAP